MRKTVVALLSLAMLGAGLLVSPGVLAGGVERGTRSVRWKPPVLVSLDQAHRETSLAINPRDEDLMFICAPSGVPSIGNKQSYFHVSRDGGATWAEMRVEGATGDPRNYAFEGGDCDVAFDGAGTMYAADTWLGDLSVGHSKDGGKTWAGTSLATSTPIVDRPWLVGGKKGEVHLSYQALQCCMPSAIWYTKSTDYGMTFKPSVPVATAGPDGAFTWEGNLTVAPNGKDLYLVYTRRDNALNPGPESVWMAASHDAGTTWTSHLITERDTSASYLYPSMAMDAAGYLHVVFASSTGDDTPIWYTVSKDKGKSWTKPTPIRRGDAGYAPWIAARGKGEAYVAWYGSPDPEADFDDEFDWYFYWARITDGHTSAPKVQSGTTTRSPIFSGQTDMPEFEMIKLDSRGRMHIGMSAFNKTETGQVTGWAIYYQSQKG